MVEILVSLAIRGGSDVGLICGAQAVPIKAQIHPSTQGGPDLCGADYPHDV